ncbi:hypothetical protein HNV11_19525 [Spirosoma taeanense]|uniref:Uncharacterized protein n=1 Tax=Spirosoma taeanense TaxID=2735870 RepID=A0A6M5YDP5_9BACT|nr:hypothetical protein [Spirosoma taeanense]QJW91411.1 hypothetical protein HNV11_19525 [Spirosoma taeanense]
MISQEESASSAYEASTTEVQNVIMEWVEATEQFHNRYAKLTEVINALQVVARRQPTANRSRLRHLTMLRQHMSDVLMTLLLDMSGQKSSRTTQPSKSGQLHSHARLLAELNRKIDAELTSVRTVAQA